MVKPVSSKNYPPHAIAIVGMAGRFPGARNLDEFWRNLRDGVESLETFTDAHLDSAGIPSAVRLNPNFVRKGTVLEGSDQFDAGFFGISPREAQIIDPQQRIFLECAWEALEHAGYASGQAQKIVGVYAGASMNTYLLTQILANQSFIDAVGGYQVMLGSDKDFLCTRVSYKLDLHGPSMTIQTACSTSLVAVVAACQALNRGECDMALAGGVSALFPQRTGYLFQEGMILSPDGHCRPFDADARGTRAGDGAGIVVLKRLSDALADGDTIHAVIRGAAINNDGADKAGYTAPSVNGQIEVIAMAQTLADVDPRSITYIEAHGTATPLGDPIEIAALTQAFRASTPDIGFCRLGSLKANLGHLDAAAGVAGLIKAVLALTHREIPPLVNFRTPNPQLNLEHSPFVASAQRSDWPSNNGVRRAGVSSFGIGGTNAHVVLEEAPPATPSKPVRDAHLLVLSAKTATALEQMTANLADALEARSDIALQDVEWTLQTGRREFSHRRALVAVNAMQAAKALRQPQRAPVLTGSHEGGVRPVAFLFSGQGSQHPGMAGGLYKTEKAFREAVDRCAELLKPLLKLDIRDLIIAKSSDAAINETRFAQPALFVVEYALACLWRSWGVTPKVMLGHSIGEYTAAHLAGVMSLEDALAVVAARGRLMQELPSGSMAAVHCAAEKLRSWIGKGVEVAAINAPELCTVSGPAAAVAEFLKRLEGKNIESRPLHTSHAFHSGMMDAALEPFTDIVKGIELRPPQIPYVSNVTGTWITPEQAMSPTYYATHLRRAVQFEAGIRTIAADPAILFLEVGPGNALASLARLTVDKQRTKHVVSSLSHPRESRADGESVLDAAGRLWLAGVELDWANLRASAERRRVPLPTYPFERKRYRVEAAPVVGQTAGSDAVSFSENVGDWLFAPTWTREPSCVSTTATISGSWLLLAQPGALTEALGNRLRAAGASPILVEDGDNFQVVEPAHFRARHEQAQDISAIVQRVRGTHSAIQGAIYLGSRSIDDCATGAASYHALVALAEGLGVSPSGPTVRIVVATFGAESVLNESVRNPAAALALGPVLVLPTEVPRLQMRAVDLDLQDGARSAEAAAKALVEEVADAGRENLVAWRGGCRWLRRFERLSLPPVDARDLPLKPRGVYLITGGLGGIGLTLAHWFAANTSARLVLTARTPLPPREQWDTWLTEHGSGDQTATIIKNIKQIEESGGEVLTAAADAADLSQMKSVIDLARERFGGIDGVVHAAGVPGTGRIAFLKQPDDIQSVFSPKVGGLDVLVSLLGGMSLDFVVLISSINAVLGAPGLSDYAGANAALDAFPDSKLRPASWKHVVSIDWGSWRDLGMAAKLFESDPRTDSQLYRRTTIPPKAGAEAFARVLSSRNRRVIVVPFSLTRHVELLLKGPSEQTLTVTADQPTALANEPPTLAAQERPEVTTAYAPPSTDIERRLTEIWTSLLGVDRIGIDDNFFELGGHSLLATRVLARIGDSLHVQLTLRSIFDAPTVRELAAEILRLAPQGHAAQMSEDREEIVF